MLKRKKIVTKLDKSKFVKVFCELANPEDYNSLREFLKIFIKRKISFNVMCFVEDRVILNSFVKSVDLFSNDFIFITSQDISLFRKENKYINDFINQPCDIFIDLCVSECFTIDYISGLTKAGLKVGSFNRKKKYHDLMIDVKINTSLNYLCEQVEHYLKMIKPIDHQSGIIQN